MDSKCNGKYLKGRAEYRANFVLNIVTLINEMNFDSMNTEIYHSKLEYG